MPPGFARRRHAVAADSQALKNGRIGIEPFATATGALQFVLSDIDGFIRQPNGRMFMKNFTKYCASVAIIALGGAGAIVTTASPASAAIACNRDGECWHVRGDYEYRPEFGVVVHPNNWRWGHRDRFRWREHEGRGYWHNGVWLAF
jgi:hypothetical protein